MLNDYQLRNFDKQVDKKVKKNKSIQAEVAQTIRKELKEKFPGIKFKVTSAGFAGGNSVDIYYNNGVPRSQVEKVVNKYQSGYFDGMDDIYKYYGNRDYPTVKYISVDRKITDDIREKTKIEIAKRYGIKNIEDENEWYDKFLAWSNTVVYRELIDKTL